MAFTTLDRTAYDLLVDDDGSGNTGSVWDKSDVGDILDAVDGVFSANTGLNINGPLVANGGVTANGTLVTANGIQFPATQNPSANANCLDDYEEGSFTPALQFGGAAVGMTYTTQTGRYGKVGQMVTFSLRITLSAKGSSTGSATIANLPFATDASVYHAFSAGWWSGLAVGFVQFGGFINPGATALVMAGATAASTGLGSLTDSSFGNSTDIIITGSYRAGA